MDCYQFDCQSLRLSLSTSVVLQLFSMRPRSPQDAISKPELIRQVQKFIGKFPDLMERFMIIVGYAAGSCAWSYEPKGRHRLYSMHLFNVPNLMSFVPTASGSCRPKMIFLRSTTPCSSVTASATARCQRYVTRMCRKVRSGAYTNVVPPFFSSGVGIRFLPSFWLLWRCMLMSLYSGSRICRRKHRQARLSCL